MMMLLVDAARGTDVGAEQRISSNELTISSLAYENGCRRRKVRHTIQRSRTHKGYMHILTIVSTSSVNDYNGG